MSVAVSKYGNGSLPLANPWWWTALGLACCGSAWLWMAGIGQSHPAGRFLLLSIGLLATAIALNIRLRFKQNVFLNGLSRTQRSLILTVLAAIFAALALAVSVMLALAFLRPDSVPWRWGPLLVCWVLVAPMSQIAASQCFHRLQQGEPLTNREEGSALLMLATLACFLSTWALYDRTDVLYMDSIRLFLSVLTVLSLAAAPLVLVPQDVRRKIISIIIVLHFIGIVTAVLASVHRPRAIQQLFDRIYRPYLQFFYITNAYHFYAPDPGPANYMWFRILYVDDDGTERGEWLKVPDLDEQGRHSSPTSLTYVRKMCIMEHAAPLEPAPAFFDVYGRPLDFFANRLKRIPGMAFKERLPVPLQAVSAVGLLGVPCEQGLLPVIPLFADRVDSQGEKELMIPGDPNFTHDQQYRRPSGDAQALLSSFARHILRQASLKLPHVKGVKMYFVTHAILTPDVYRFDVAEPWDPHTYRAFYLGQFDAEGRLTDPQDPFLYWMLPTVRETPRRDSVYRSYIRKHAGDPDWIRNEDGRWVDKLGS